MLPVRNIQRYSQKKVTKVLNAYLLYSIYYRMSVRKDLNHLHEHLTYPKKHQRVSNNHDWPQCTITYIVLFRMLMHDLGLSRRACDRCHGQKLRCKRESIDGSCVRCQRAGVQCVPRPSRSQRRTRSNVYHQTQASGSENRVNLGVF